VHRRRWWVSKLGCHDGGLVSAQCSWLSHRTVVIGCAGSGESTLAALLASRLGVPHIPRDWLGLEGSDEYHAAVAAAISAERWVFDGAPYYVEELVYRRATLIVGFELPRRCVMRRVISRSVCASIGLVPTPPHRDRRWRAWLDPEHPVRWAWSTWPERRHELHELVDSGTAGEATVVSLSTPAGVTAWLAGHSDSGWVILSP
jgi:hypothetical protein